MHALLTVIGMYFPPPSPAPASAHGKCLYVWHAFIIVHYLFFFLCAVLYCISIIPFLGVQKHELHYI